MRRDRGAREHRRVLHVMQAAHIGGAERHLLDLLPRLRANGWDARFYGFTTLDEARFPPALRGTGVPVTVDRVSRLFSFDVIRRVARAIRGFDPDVVHTHLFYGDVAGQAVSVFKRVPSVRTIHGSLALWPSRRERAAAWVVGKMARRTIAVSGHVADFARRSHLAPETRIRIIRHGLDPGEWQSTRADRVDARARWGIDQDAIVISCSSRLVAGKGQDSLIESASIARRSVPGLTVLIAGGGPEKPALEALAARLLPASACRFVGELSDVRPLLWASDIFAFPTLPSLGEAFGLAALEAMAAGLPVVASDLPSLRELVDDGQTGRLVEPGNTSALAAVLVALAAAPDLRQAMADAAVRRVKESFSVDRMVDATVETYEELVVRKAR